jgi:hypothetical protein
MQRSIIITLLLVVGLFPHAGYAEPDGSTQTTTATKTTTASSCDAARASGNLTKTYETKNIKEALKQLDKTSTDTITINPQTKGVTMKVECPAKKTTTPGVITVCLDPSCKVKATIKKEGAFMSKLEASTQSVGFSLASNDQVVSEVSKQLFNDPGIRSQLDQGLAGIDQAFSGLSAEAKAALPALKEGYEKTLQALAQGDVSTAASTMDKALRESPEIQAFLKDPNNIARLASDALPAEVKEVAGTLLPQVCSTIGGILGDSAGTAACQKSVSTFTGQPEPAARPAYENPVAADASGRIDPVAFAQRAAYKVANSSLNGYAPPELRPFGITTGSPEEWARFYTMITKQESNMRVAPTNADGSLQRFPSTPAGERSYGPGQFNVGEYGLNSWADVNNPDRVIDAYMQVTQKGKLFQYFGSLQRPNETLQHAGWYSQTVAPRIADTSYVPSYTTNPAPSQSSPFSIGGIFSSGSGGSSGVGGMISSLFGGGSTGGGIVSGISSLFGGGSSQGLFGGLSSLFGNSGIGSLLGGLFGGSQGSSGSSSGTAAGSGTAASPTTGNPTPTPPTSPTAPLVTPSIAFSVAPTTITSTQKARVTWAATGVQSCTLQDTTVRATGTTGSFLYERSYAASAPTVTLTLTCTPTDSRISAAQATKSVSLRVE